VSAPAAAPAARRAAPRAAPRAARRLALAPLASLALLAAGCDFRVTNPGPVQDELLNLPSTAAAIVNGSDRALAEALNWVAYTGGAITREINAAGSLNLCGISLAQREGRLLPDEVDTQWSFAQRARFVAESGVARLESVLGDGFAADSLAARALLDAGYANRLLGENMCNAVVDGGAAEPSGASFERAEAAFTRAAAVAAAARNARIEAAAYAGRAAVRVQLGKWDEAEADAQRVPAGFVYQMQYNDIEEAQRNRLFWCNGNQPYRAHTVKGTFYEAYYTQTRDPRVSWSTSAQFPVGDAGQIPWLFQTKFAARNSPIRLSSEREMKLILAEANLRRGAWPAALAQVNALRAAVSVPPWQAASAAEAWTHLKRERGIELWLEGRRLGDLRRWARDNTPGAMEELTGRDSCFPIGQTERETNPNLGI
jgi:hypothetical protein